MYLKLRTSNESNGWRVFEADNIQWNYHSAESLKELLSEHEQLLEVAYEDFTGDDKPDCDICLLTFESRDGALHEIYTIGDVFLLNDSGKTIERIN